MDVVYCINYNTILYFRYIGTSAKKTCQPNQRCSISTTIYEKKKKNIYFNFHIYFILYFSVLFVPENKNQIQSHIFPHIVHFSNICAMNV